MTVANGTIWLAQDRYRFSGKFERKQALVCLVILGGMLAIYLVVIPLAKAASS